MAISARTASLQAQRNPYTSYRVLAPRDTKVSTIAHQAATRELAVMVERYNDGVVGVDEMSSFLQKMSVNPSLNSEELGDVQNYIRDFENRARIGKLEAVYQNAQDGSMEKVTAAQALSNYFSQRAATLSPGTPAQSDALQEQGKWNQIALTEQNQVEKQFRSNQRYQMEALAFQNPPSTSQRSYELAQMYQSLSQQAQADGDITEANRFMSLAQQQKSQGDVFAQNEFERSTKEQQQQMKQNITDYLGNLENQYHDGKIDENQYLQSLAEIQTYIDSSNDYGLINRFNRITDTVQKNLEKGGLLRGTTTAGLPVVLGKGPAGGQSTDWDVEDYNYSDNLKTVEGKFRNGEIDANKYSELVGKILQSRQTQLDERTILLEQKAQANPNEKVIYEGRKQRVVDVLASIDKQNEELAPQIQAYQNGTFRLMETAPDATTKTGKLSTQYRLIDVNAIPENERDQYAEDESGILHSIIREQLNLTPDVMNDPLQVSNGYYTDPVTNQSQPIKYDSAGNPYIYGKSQVNVYKPGTNEKITVDYVEGQPIKSWDNLNKEMVESQRVKEEQAVIEAQKDKPAINLDRRPLTQKIQETVQPVVADVVNKAEQVDTSIKQAIPQPVKDVVKQAPIEYAVSKLPEPIKQTVQPIVQKVTQPIQNFINPPSYSAPSTPPSGGTYKPTISVNNQTMVKQYSPTSGITYQPLKPAPYKAPAPAPTQSLGTKILNVVKQSPFNFLKSLW